MKIVVPIALSLLATAIAVVASRIVKRLSLRAHRPAAGPVADPSPAT